MIMRYKTIARVISNEENYPHNEGGWVAANKIETIVIEIYH